MLKNQRSYHFGDFSLELDPPALHRGLETIKIPQRQMEALCLLAQAGGSPVAKSFFFERIWSGAFVEEGNLTQTIFLLRRTLGKLPDGGEYIETLPRLGYRLSPTALAAHGSHLSHDTHLSHDALLSRDNEPHSAKRPHRQSPSHDGPSLHDAPHDSPLLKEGALISASSLAYTLKNRVLTVLQPRWEPVFWIGVGMLVSLFAVLVALFSLAYVNSTNPSHAALPSAQLCSFVDLSSVDLSPLSPSAKSSSFRHLCKVA